jgi:hypothetical protein
MLIMVCGLQGTGKTTIAKLINSEINGILISSDVIRKELFRNRNYGKDETKKNYDEMIRRAKCYIDEGQNVVLDATFAKKEYRDKAKSITKKFIIIETICPENIVKERLKNRKNSYSEADYNIYLLRKNAFEPIEEEHITIDTSNNIESQMSEFYRIFNILSSH